jgi:hypothetical protein
LGLFPDLFINEQIGLLSGMFSFIQLFSTALGVSLLGYLFSVVNTLVIVATVSACMVVSALLLMLTFKEPKWHYHSVVRWIRSLRRYKARVVDRMDQKWQLLHQEQLQRHTTRPNQSALFQNQVQDVQDEDFLSEAEIAVLDSTPASPTTLIAPLPTSTADVPPPPPLSQSIIALPGKIISFFTAFFSPFKSWSFIWLFITRGFFSLGMGVVQNFSLFFFREKVGPVYKIFKNTTLVEDEQQAQAVFMLCVLVTGLVSSIVGGLLSDRIGRRIVIMIGSFIMAIGLLAMGLVSFNYTFLLACGLVMGCGAGSFLASDLGLANDIIDPTESAKELALFQMAQTLPMVISSPLGGLIVQLGEVLNKDHVIKVDKIGYNIMLFFCSALGFATGAFIWCIRVTRFKAPQEDTVDENEIVASNVDVPVEHSNDITTADITEQE